MSKYYGNIIEDDTIELTFNTFDADGASVTVTTFASTDVHVHKDGGLTQTNAGVTIDIDFDGVTGNHVIYIDTSADVFYATGSNYEVRVEGITVATQIINAFIGSFSIENRYMRGTDGANTVVPMVGTLSQTEHDATQSSIEALNDFDPASDTVGLVSLVTENTDMRGTDGVDTANMRGTDGANTTTPAVPGDNMNLADNAIKSAKYDELTAFPIKSADTGSTQIARTGADGDTLEAISNQIDDVEGNFFADEVFIPASGTILYNKKGTVTQLSKKDLKDPSGNAVNSTEDIIAEATEQ